MANSRDFQDINHLLKFNAVNFKAKVSQLRINSEDASNTKRQEEKAAALKRLERIRARIEYYKSIKQAPSPDLLQEAQAIAELMPDGDLKAVLAEIRSAAIEAIKMAEINIALGANTGAAWLNSNERREFDRAVATDALKALAEHSEDARVIATKGIINDILADKEISDEKFREAVNHTQSAEMRYKRESFFYYAPVEIEKLRLQGKDTKQAESNLLEQMKAEILNQAVLHCKKVRADEGRSTDHEVVIREDKPQICHKVMHTVEAIEQHIEGGLLAAAKAGGKRVEVIQDVMAGKREQAGAKVAEQQRINEQIARREPEQEGKRIEAVKQASQSLTREDRREVAFKKEERREGKKEETTEQKQTQHKGDKVVFKNPEIPVKTRERRSVVKLREVLDVSENSSSHAEIRSIPSNKQDQLTH